MNVVCFIFVFIHFLNMLLISKMSCYASTAFFCDVSFVGLVAGGGGGESLMCLISPFLCVGSLISSLPHLHGLPAILYIIILQRNNSPRLPLPVTDTFELLLRISARTISTRTTKFWPVFCVLKFDELTFSGKDFSVVHPSL